MTRWILPILLLASQASFAVEEIIATDVPVEVPVAEAKATTALKETEIPVHLEAVKKGPGGDSPWLRMLGGLLVVGVLAAGSMYYVRKTKSANRTSSLAPEIKVLAQHYLGPKKSLAIIRVAGESILLGVTENNISMIKSLSLLDEDIPEVVPGNFDSVFNKKIEAEAPAINASKEDDEFSISGIKDVVTTRLKNMRNFQ